MTTRVAWRRSQSLYNLGPPTTIHRLPADSTVTACGLPVPREALPGYVEPEGLPWFDRHVFPCNVDDPYDFATLNGLSDDERRDCRRCLRAAPHDLPLHAG